MYCYFGTVDKNHKIPAKCNSLLLLFLKWFSSVFDFVYQRYYKYQTPKACSVVEKNITRARLASLMASPLVILDSTRDVFSTTERLPNAGGVR